MVIFFTPAIVFLTSVTSSIAEHRPTYLRSLPFNVSMDCVNYYRNPEAIRLLVPHDLNAEQLDSIKSGLTAPTN